MAKAPIFDVAEYLDHPEIVANYLTEAIATGDTKVVAEAIGDVARARGRNRARSIGTIFGVKFLMNGARHLTT